MVDDVGAASSSGVHWLFIPEFKDSFGSMAQTHFDRVIFENNLMSIDAGIPKLPWEEGAFGQIFEDGDALGLPVGTDMIPQPAFPVIPQPDAEKEDGGAPPGWSSEDLPMFAKHVTTLCDSDCKKAQELKWTRALARWRSTGARGLHTKWPLQGEDLLDYLERCERDGRSNCSLERAWCTPLSLSGSS